MNFRRKYLCGNKLSDVYLSGKGLSQDVRKFLLPCVYLLIRETLQPGFRMDFSNRKIPPDMKNALRVLFYASVLLSMQCGVLQAEQYSNVEVRKILVSSKTSDGRTIQYLKTSTPEVTALEVTFPPGGSTGWHQHPVPVYAYVLDGTLTVSLENGQSLIFNKGDAIFEVMNTLHNGSNLGTVPVRLVVFYTGAVGVPNVIRQEQTLPQPRPEPAHAGE